MQSGLEVGFLQGLSVIIDIYLKKPDFLQSGLELLALELDIFNKECTNPMIKNVETRYIECRDAIYRM